MAVWRLALCWISKDTRAQTHAFDCAPTHTSPSTSTHALTNACAHTHTRIHTCREICNTCCYFTATGVYWTHLNVALRFHCVSCVYFINIASLAQLYICRDLATRFVPFLDCHQTVYINLPNERIRVSHRRPATDWYIFTSRSALPDFRAVSLLHRNRNASRSGLPPPTISSTSIIMV